jgi:hypothetical protein
MFSCILLLFSNLCTAPAVAGIAVPHLQRRFCGKMVTGLVFDLLFEVAEWLGLLAARLCGC